LTLRDYVEIGDRLVKQAAQIGVGDRVVILYDPNKNPELIRAARAAIAMSGAVLAAEWPRPVDATLEARRAMSDADLNRLIKTENDSFSRTLKSANVLLWLDSGNSLDGAKRWEKLLAGAPGVRSVHAHWFAPPMEQERCDVERNYLAAMRVSPALLGEVQARAAEALLKAQDVVISDSHGTRLSVVFDRSGRFDINNGAMTLEKSRSARSVRGREEEFPASAIRTTMAKIDGTLVARSMFSEIDDRLQITFVDSRIVAVDGDPRDVDQLRSLVDTVSGAHFAELVIGMNAALRKTTSSGWPIYYGSGGGMVQIRIGDNWESGGASRAADHKQDIFLLPNATVTADETTIISDGEIAIDRIETQDASS
jgi:leucyl aminopeptidase (aminopeptidase T)